MTTITMRTRIITGCLATIFLSFGAILAGTSPATAKPVASPVGSELVPAMAPLARASGRANVPWASTSFTRYAPAGICPLKQADETAPAFSDIAVPDVMVPHGAPPATVQNLRRADG